MDILEVYKDMNGVKVMDREISYVFLKDARSSQDLGARQVEEVITQARDKPLAKRCCGYKKFTWVQGGIEYVLKDKMRISE